MSVPGYWMNETSGALRPAVAAYLNGDPMTLADVAAMRAYLRQWISSPDWIGPAIGPLRDAIDGIVDRETIRAWLEAADDAGCDPL